MDITKRLQTRETMLEKMAQKEYAVTKFLEASGWRHSSTNPACWWMWEKKLPDGRTVLVTQETAVNFQASMDGVSGDLDGDG
jgi:hypothetical protein